ncbi:alpha-L-fucosidase [Actinopolymorpha alba]|uniref:alpha-L-fucosidase n=1 Tax=Actinopolymorpha alba TaxID=533267 RepID=UPI0003721F8D|nr:alpha-L-fucosidase [Actinopolymorpha alba]
MSRWFEDAKFGIWAHWGPQSVPMRGDWYARRLYLSPDAEKPDALGPSRRRTHEERFGHPSEFGHKDICRAWTAERWDPDALMDLYVRAGARYFVSLANHIDNFDLWNSLHQPWNSVNVGPKRDVVEEWARAARRHNLPFGLSFHANWSWQLLDVAFGADQDGPLPGVPYDGHLTAADGAGRWWDGLDPAKLYGRSRRGDEPPDPDVVADFYRRVWDAFTRYRPEFVYFDDSRLPFASGSICETRPPTDAGAELLHRMHEHSRLWHGDRSRLIATIKQLVDSDTGGVTLDVERNLLVDMRDRPWQMDTCLGHWFYEKDLPYKSARQVLQMLVDVVSKNGSLLLSVPQRPDGTIDAREVAILEEIGAWLRHNGEAIYGSRPWKVYGEGSTTGERNGDRFPEADLPYTGEDVRFTAKDGSVYAIVLGEPHDQTVRLTSLGRAAGLLASDPARVEVVGVKDPLRWVRTERALEISLPPQQSWLQPLVLRIDEGGFTP